MAAAAALKLGLCSCCCLANSTISTAFFTLMPAKTTKPIWVKMLSSQAAEIDAGDAAEEAHGDDQDDGRGEREAFIFGGVGEEDEQDAEGEDDEKLATAPESRSPEPQLATRPKAAFPAAKP